MSETMKCRACEGVGEKREYVCNPILGGVERLYTTEKCAACNGTGIEEVE